MNCVAAVRSRQPRRWASAILIVVGLFIRLKVAESPVFEAVRDTTTVRLPIAEVFRRHPRQVALGAGAFLVQSTVSYIFIAYLATYGTTVVGASRTSVLGVIVLSAAISTVLHVVAGAASDRFGRKPVYIWGVIGMGAFIFPAFALFDTGQFTLMLAAHILVFGVALSPSGGPTGAMFAEMFSTRVRYSGASVSYQLAGVLGAALGPIIAASLIEATGSGYAIAGYIAAVAAISLVSIALIREPRHNGHLEPEIKSPVNIR